jgi:hypothetical protein
MSVRFCDIAMILSLVFALLASGCNRSTTGEPSAPSQPAASAPSRPLPPPPPPPPAPTLATLPVWTPDPAFLDQLEPYQDIEGYQIRLPKGFESKGPANIPFPGAREFGWVGASRTDGTKPTFYVEVITSPPERAAEARDMALGQFITAILPSQDMRGPDWQQGPLESGQINGLTFLRTSFQTTVPGTAVKIRAVGYVANDSSTLIAVRASDADAYQEQSLRLGAAAIMTFRKKQ